MTTLINGRTPEQYAAWNRWHAIIAALLTLLLLVLWFTGKGPGYANGSGTCCSSAAPAPAATTAVAPAAVLDADADGIADTGDKCPQTPVGTSVDSAGCPVTVAETGATQPGPDAAAAGAAGEGAAASAAAVPAANLYFTVDKFDLPADYQAALAEVVAYVQANAGAKAVISGYHSPEGNKAYNMELAKNRAKAVREYLKSVGIDETRIEMRKPIETTGSGSLDEARRVEVSVE